MISFFRRLRMDAYARWGIAITVAILAAAWLFFGPLFALFGVGFAILFAMAAADEGPGW